MQGLVVSVHVKPRITFQLGSLYINISSCQLQVAHSIQNKEVVCIYVMKIFLEESCCFKRPLPNL